MDIKLHNCLHHNGKCADFCLYEHEQPHCKYSICWLSKTLLLDFISARMRKLETHPSPWNLCTNVWCQYFLWAPESVRLHNQWASFPSSDKNILSNRHRVETPVRRGNTWPALLFWNAAVNLILVISAQGQRIGCNNNCDKSTNQDT